MAAKKGPGAPSGEPTGRRKKREKTPTTPDSHPGSANLETLPATQGSLEVGQHQTKEGALAAITSPSIPETTPEDFIDKFIHDLQKRFPSTETLDESFAREALTELYETLNKWENLVVHLPSAAKEKLQRVRTTFPTEFTQPLLAYFSEIEKLLKPIAAIVRTKDPATMYEGEGEDLTLHSELTQALSALFKTMFSSNKIGITLISPTAEQAARKKEKMDEISSDQKKRGLPEDVPQINAEELAYNEVEAQDLKAIYDALRQETTNESEIQASTRSLVNIHLHHHINSARQINWILEAMKKDKGTFINHQDLVLYYINICRTLFDINTATKLIKNLLPQEESLPQV